jgi:peptide/nickel transport system permease protein
MVLDTTLASTPAPIGAPVAAARTRRSRVLTLPHSPKVVVGLVIIGVFLVVAIFGGWMAPYSPNATDQAHWVQRVLAPGTGPGTGVAARYYPLPLPPSGSHLLGTTYFAQDVLSQLLAATQATLFVGVLAGAIATLLSVVVGVAAGYFGGLRDEGLSLLSNVFLAVPGFPLLIVLADYVPNFGSNLAVIALIIAVTAWAYTARVLRAQTLSLRNRDFVEAARVSGEGRMRIIMVEVLPNLIPIVAASFLFTTLYAIGVYVGLAFLGLAGAPTAQPAGLWNWGEMLREAWANNAVRSGWWWWWAPPGICIALLGTGLALLNFAIDEFINPRLRVAGLSRRAARAVGLSRRPIFGVTAVVRRPAGRERTPA